MALTVEDGTGVAGADAWSTYAQYVTWHTNYYGAAPTDTEALVEGAMRRAVVYVGTLDISGSKTYGRAQGTCLPRKGMTDCDGNAIASDEMPTEFIYAAYELTRAELTTPGILAPKSSVSGIVKREKVDTLEVEYDTSNADGSADDNRTTITAAIDVIQCFLNDVPGDSYMFSAMVV